MGEYIFKRGIKIESERVYRFGRDYGTSQHDGVAADNKAILAGVKYVRR